MRFIKNEILETLIAVDIMNLVSSVLKTRLNSSLGLFKKSFIP